MIISMNHFQNYHVSKLIKILIIKEIFQTLMIVKNLFQIMKILIMNKFLQMLV